MITYYGGYIDIDGNPVERTPHTNPYTYDDHVIFRSGPNTEIDNTAYSDRILQWDYEKARNLQRKHFVNRGDYYPREDAKKVQAFLRDYFDAPKLELIVITEGCNQSSGYPVWCFHMKMNKDNENS